jgi:hypothetical protein
LQDPRATAAPSIRRGQEQDEMPVKNDLEAELRWEPKVMAPQIGVTVGLRP